MGTSERHRFRITQLFVYFLGFLFIYIVMKTENKDTPQEA